MNNAIERAKQDLDRFVNGNDSIMDDLLEVIAGIVQASAMDSDYRKEWEQYSYYRMSENEQLIA